MIESDQYRDNQSFSVLDPGKYHCGIGIVSREAAFGNKELDLCLVFKYYHNFNIYFIKILKICQWWKIWGKIFIVFQ